MSEKTLQESLKATLEALTGWDTVKVVINDWRVLDGSTTAAPYAIIETADGFSSDQTAMIPTVNWQIPVTLFVAWKDWGAAYDHLRDLRQAVIDEIAKNAQFATCYLVNTVRNDGLVGEWYDPYQNQDINPMPIFVIQRLILEVEESVGCE
jgi:hypothetical protein